MLCPCRVFLWVTRHFAFSFSVPQNTMWALTLVPLPLQSLPLGLTSFSRSWGFTRINSYRIKEPFLLSLTGKPPIDFTIRKGSSWRFITLMATLYPLNIHFLILYDLRNLTGYQVSYKNETLLNLRQTGWQQLQRLPCLSPFPTSWLTVLSDTCLTSFKSLWGGISLHPQAIFSKASLFLQL